MSAEILREAARLMREDNPARSSALFCECEVSDHWFDRSICPEPCGSMHDVCIDCGRVKGYCAVAVEGRANGDRLSATWLAMADLLDAHVDRIEATGFVGHQHGRLVTLARTYLGQQ